jgi:serine/threonine-protein phosphatase 2A regulatory subunit B
MYDTNREAVVPSAASTGIKVPKLQVQDATVTATPKKIYSNAHAYHINSLSPNSDGETYISVDDLRINMWHLDSTDSCFNIVDIKPDNMEDLAEVITSATFHPTHCNILMYGSSQGTIKLGDLRASALCDRQSKVFQDSQAPCNTDNSQYLDIVSSISDVKFTADGRYILSRDFMTLKFWDMHMEREPVFTYQVHDHLNTKLTDLYNNDMIFDKFECAVSQNGHNLVTGGYNSIFNVFDRQAQRVSSVSINRY